MFRAAYGRAPNFADIRRAIAAFERALIFLDAPFDRYILGDVDAISADAKKAGCSSMARLVASPATRSIPPTPSAPTIVSQYRRFSAESRFRKTGHRGSQDSATRSVDGKPRRSGPGDRQIRTRPLYGDQEPVRHRRLPHLAVAQHRHHRSVHARWFHADIVGRSRSLQQGWRGQPIPRQRHRTAGAQRSGDRSAGRLHVRPDRPPPRYRQSPADEDPARPGRQTAAIPRPRSRLSAHPGIRAQQIERQP
ncbi:MAG: cytochrome-c peroxidase [Proteobacteria bacterium]|nr:cytochrome-c peroxidase [Pseudomonadota bacterium]